MELQMRRAERSKTRIKMALQGPSGSGKTLSSLHIAYGLCQRWSNICVIDTEHGSADLYSHLGHYMVLPLMKPFSPENYVKAIEICEKSGVEVIIIDSLSHEWEGTGGILQIHSHMTGNSFTNWSKLTPRHNALVQKILESPVHIISTIRSKQDYVLSEKNGKQVPEKVGLKGITREGMDYEMTLVLDLDLKHNAEATKDRTGLFMDKPSFVITPETGRKILDWCNEGIGVDDVINRIGETNSVNELRKIYSEFPQFQNEIEPALYERKAQIEGQVRKVS